MKFIASIVCTILILPSLTIFSQTLLVDQQSTNLKEGAVFIGDITGRTGQLFTPAFSSLGFVSLQLYDADALHSLGATLMVNIRAASIDGPILGVSLPVVLPDNFYGITSFSFSTVVSVVPGVSYYFQPFIQSGDNFGAYITDGSYSGGSIIFQGNAVPGYNLWFQEGIVVPEPSAVSLVLVGALLGRYRCKRCMEF